MQRRITLSIWWGCLAILVCVAMVAGTVHVAPVAAAPEAVPLAQPGGRPDLFGLNMYITGRERDDTEALALIGRARGVGAVWTREEISWAAWGEGPANTFYDRRIGWLADAGMGIVGMLLTTPERYRSRDCMAHARATDQPAYWCAPTNPAAYARWAAQVVERYDGDGIDDAPGSPRIAAWEIWNEPDQDGTWLPKADPEAYGRLLRAASDAIRAADPTALILNGGVMTFDSVGVNGFMSRAVAVAGWDSFDVVSIHPWLIDYAPDDPVLINPREGFDVTIPGRLAMVQRWIAEHGGGKPIWITEVGWSTCATLCEPQFAKSETQQADFMVRTFVLAAAAGVEHVSYFQLEDKFQGAQLPWSQAAILRDDLSAKPAYTAFGVLVAQLAGARYSGPGPLHRPGVLANYRFALPAGGTVDVLWRIAGTQTVELPLTGGLYAQAITRDGVAAPLTAGRSARLQVGEQPLYVRQSAERLQVFAETGQTVRGQFLDYWERNGGLAILGLPISAERREIGADGQSYRVQWFERARLEYHPALAAPNNVQQGLLGVEYLAHQGIDWRSLPSATSVAEGCRYFEATAHTLCPPFRDYWERNGGLAVFGYPISEAQPERLADGQVLTMQYFERSRFEHHPQQPAPYDVLLSRLGSELAP